MLVFCRFDVTRARKFQAFRMRLALNVKVTIANTYSAFGVQQRMSSPYSAWRTFAHWVLSLSFTGVDDSRRRNG